MAEEEGLSLPLLCHNVSCPFPGPSSRLAAPRLRSLLPTLRICRRGHSAPGSLCLRRRVVGTGVFPGDALGGAQAPCEARSPPAPCGAAATVLAGCLPARALAPEDNI